MAQIFHPSTNVLSRLTIFIVFIAGPCATLYLGSAVTRSSINTNVGVPIAQPVPFSHEHHAIELGIDCRYCHTEVEKSYNAGLPPTETCMSCHSQIWTDSPLLDPVRESYAKNQPILWNRLNSVPSFVYFPHDIHIARGISCNNCHGPIQRMMITYKGKALFMVFCLNCHRQPEKFLAPKSFVFQLYRDIQRYGYHEDDTGKNGLTPRESELADGNYWENRGADLAEGERLMKVYHVNEDQLTNCSVCHR